MHVRNFAHMQVLLSAGADTNIADHNERSPLMLGVLDYDEASPTTPGLKLLLKFGAELTRTDEGGLSPADLALQRKAWPCLDFLEKAGAAVTPWRETRPSRKKTTTDPPSD